MISFLQLTTLAAVVLILVLSAHSDFCPAHNATTPDSMPSVCSLSVTVTRAQGCSVRVTEQLVLSFTTGAPFKRIILIPSRKLSRVTYRRDGREDKVNASWVRRAHALLSMRTEQSPVSTKLELGYSIGDSVVQTKRACANPKRAKNTTVMQWRSGRWGQNLANVKVRLVAGAGELLVLEHGFYTITNVGPAEAFATMPFRRTPFEIIARVEPRPNSRPRAVCLPARVSCAVPASLVDMEMAGKVAAGAVGLFLVLYVFVIAHNCFRRIKRRIGTNTGAFVASAVASD